MYELSGAEIDAVSGGGWGGIKVRIRDSFNTDNSKNVNFEQTNKLKQYAKAKGDDGDQSNTQVGEQSNSGSVVVF